MFILRTLAVIISCYCVLGAPERRSIPIVNGQNADKDEYPWQIAMKYNGGFLCGGSIINARTILTAAHCVEDDPRQRYGQFSITAGEWDRSIYEGTEQTVNVAEIIMHNQYDTYTLDNDIALLILEDDLVFSSSIQPIGRLSTKKFDKTAVQSPNCSVSGWGRFNDRTNQLPNIMQELESTDVVSNKKCNKALRGTGLSVTNKMVCTLDDNAGICNGDSGGPMGCIGSQGAFVQVGVVSWGPSRQCANGRQVFVRVSKYAKWINNRKAQV